jgi:hypothetical protein
MGASNFKRQASLPASSPRARNSPDRVPMKILSFATVGDGKATMSGAKKFQRSVPLLTS